MNTKAHKSFAEKRGLPNTIKYGEGKDVVGLQVMCSCNDNYNKQLRKLKTMPVSARVIVEIKKETISHCGECGCMPWVIMPRGIGEKLSKNWLNAA